MTGFDLGFDPAQVGGGSPPAPAVPALPIGWTAAGLADLHPAFVTALVPALAAAEAEGLHPRRRSGARANAEQAQLFLAYTTKRAAWEAGGKVGPGPLPAAPPGTSAHNFAVCPKDPGHVIGPHTTCPTCGAVAQPASLAADVALLDDHGTPIGSGGGLPLGQRPAAWQQWAALLTRFPLLRDGGTFSSPDTVHVELTRWDHTSRTLRP